MIEYRVRIAVSQPHTRGEGGGDFAYERMGVLAGKFELNALRRPIMAWPRIFDP